MDRAATVRGLHLESRDACIGGLHPVLQGRIRVKVRVRVKMRACIPSCRTAMKSP